MTVTAHEQRALVDWTGSCLPAQGAILRSFGGSSLSEARPSVGSFVSRSGAFPRSHAWTGRARPRWSGIHLRSASEFGMHRFHRAFSLTPS